MAGMPSDVAERRPIRLLWLIDSLAADSLILQFARAIDKREVELQLCSIEPLSGDALEKRLRDAGVSLTSLNARRLRDIGGFRQLLALLRDQKIQLVHAHFTHAIIWGVLACRRRKIPIVSSLHAAPVASRGFNRDSLRQWLLVESLKWIRNSTVAVSAAVKDATVRSYGFDAYRIEVIPSGVKAVSYERRNRERAIQLRPQFKFPNAAKVIIAVSKLRAGKGIDLLLRALVAVRGNVPDVRLLIAGDGPMKDQWTRLAKHLGVDDITHWAGYRDDVATLLAGSDLFVLPSREDVFPTVILEAMAAELPIVATEVGAVPDILTSTSGVIVPPGDPAALAEAISRVLLDPATGNAMAVAARRRVAENFSQQKWMEGLMKTYRTALRRRTGKLRLAVVEFSGTGGPIHDAFQLCRALAAEGAEVSLVTDQNYELEDLKHPFLLKKLFASTDPKINEAGKPRLSLRGILRGVRNYREWMRLARHLNEERYDVVQFGDLVPADFFPLRLIRRRARLLTDVCQTVRRVSGDGSNATDRLYRRMYKLFDALYVPYQANSDEFRRGFPEVAERVETIVRGSPDLFREIRGALMTANRLRTQLGIFPGDEVILFFGTLSASKGIDVLVEAFASVALRHPRAQLVIAGEKMPDFSIESHLAMARNLGAADRVRIIPQYVESAAVAGWMELASVVVFPNRELNRTGTLQLAQVFGVPIVATRVGATAEVIEHGVTGLLVPPEFPDELADAITRLLEDRDFAKQLGDAARADAETRFPWRNVAASLLQSTESHFARTE